MVLVMQFHILHHDISVNNIMIWAPKGETQKGHGETSDNVESPRVDGPGNETHEQKLARWDQERRNLIRAGVLHCGLLIDFDYATCLDQTLPVVPGDRTVSILLI